MSTHAPTAHARLAPSSSKRWLACPGSALAEMPEVENVYGGREEGTNAHEWAAKVLTCDATLGEVPAEAQKDVSLFVDHVLANQAEQCYVEQQWASKSIPEFFGTIDCLLIDGTRAAIYDFKTGKWDVQATDNKQLLCYAAIVAEHFEIDEFFGVIIQPNSKSVKGRQPKVAEFTPAEVANHRIQVAKAAVSTELVAGDHCLFCPLLQAGQCQVGREHSDKNGWTKRYRHLQPLLGA